MKLAERNAFTECVFSFSFITMKLGHVFKSSIQDYVNFCLFVSIYVNVGPSLGRFLKKVPEVLSWAHEYVPVVFKDKSVAVSKVLERRFGGCCECPRNFRVSGPSRKFQRFLKRLQRY